MGYFQHNSPTKTCSVKINGAQSMLQDEALLEAANFGHHRCVRVLLKHGADIKATDDSDQNNCLMKAIERNHRYGISS